jgi:hypothetical protein
LVDKKEQAAVGAFFDGRGDDGYTQFLALAAMSFRLVKNIFPVVFQRDVGLGAEKPQLQLIPYRLAAYSNNPVALSEPCAKCG